MRPLDLISLAENLSLAEGQSQRMFCPDCGGKNCFVITKKDGNLLWNCHRTSCTLSGGTRSFYEIDTIKKKLDKPEKFEYNSKFEVPKHFSVITGRTEVISFIKDLGLTDAADRKRLEFLYDPKENSLVTLVKDISDGKIIGATGKPLDWYPGHPKLPKWRNYDKSRRGLYVPHFGLDSDLTTPEVGIVEDILSGAAVSRLFDAYVLRGTHFSDEKFLEILQYWNEVYTMLDPGAHNKALEIEGRLAPWVKTHVLRLTDDPKNLKEDVLKEFIEHWKGNL